VFLSGGFSFWKGKHMNTQDFKRKLTAVFSADVAGYSRLMGDNEAATVQTLEAYKQVMFSLIQQHRGRVIDSPGDNLLAEFASVVDAVQCGVAVQKELQARNAELPEIRKMQFRIGINLGDVIEEQDRIYGDGVNIAARLESCADPGGICVSKTAFDHIETKLPLGYEYLGEKEVKNIAKPVGAYRVLMEPRVTVAGAKEKKPSIAVWPRRWVFAGTIAVLILLVGAAFWNFYFRPPKIEPANKEKMAFPLPDKPSIAVLPFANMSGDPKQEFLCDGITENIITALSKVPKLFVIARNSTFTYKGKPVKVKQVGEELGVQYVLEGSIQKSADRIRITAQLIDVLNGYHIWADRYDRDLKDLFAMQDEITIKIISALQVKLTGGETAQIVARSTQNLQAYLKVLEAREAFYTITKEGFARARRLCEEAIAFDPEYAAAYVYLGSANFMDVVLGSSKSPKDSLKHAFEMIKKAIALDEPEPSAHSVMGILYVMTKQYDKGISECERAIALAPNSSTANIWMATVLFYAGRHEEAVRYAEQALRLDPLPVGWYFRGLGNAYFGAGRYEEAIVAHRKALKRAPDDIVTHLALTTAYSWAGHLEEARAQAAEVVRINPKFSVEQAEKRSIFKYQADTARFYDGLRKAGLPEKPPLPLPDNPSIAVLPFTNMSDDKSQEYFSDGLTEEIITALSKTPKLFVIARNSSFVYKGKAVNVQQVGRELGVKYVLEGSVRKSGNEVRITAQLIDAMTGNHLWADRYERELKDIFAIQDEVTLKILASVTGMTVSTGEAMRFSAKGASNLEAYLKAMEGGVLFSGFNRDDNFLAGKKFEEAIALDPHWAQPYALLSSVYAFDFRLTQNPESLKKAYEYAQKAISLDETQCYAYLSLVTAYSFQRRYEEAIAAGEQAIKVAPGSADAYSSLGWSLLAAGRYKEALLYIERALRMNPFPPTYYFMQIGTAHLFLRNYEKAVPALRKALSISPKNQYARFGLIVTHVEMGRLEEARAETEELLMIDPKWNAQEFLRKAPWKDPKVTERWAEAIRKVGLERNVSTD
jgi:adenylate cyclase